MNIEALIQNRITENQKRFDTIQHLFRNYSEVNLPPLCGTMKQLYDEELVLRGVIKELRRILQDVEACEDQLAADAR
jgi:hypothetical protein